MSSDVPQLLGGKFLSLSYEEGQQWCDVFSSYRFCLIHGSQILSAVCGVRKVGRLQMAKVRFCGLYLKQLDV